jgi:hypothetical protein
MQMDEIDRNADLSPKANTATKTLARARQAVELAVAKHNLEQHVKDATRKALKEAEQGWQRAIDKIAERASLTKGPDTRR